MTRSTTLHRPAADDLAVARYALSLGDDALVLAQRLCEWATRAPAIEEDVALMNIALDLLGQARELLSYAGALQGDGRTEDDLAYLRDERYFTNLQIVELPNGDFAQTMARQLLFSAYQLELYDVLSCSTDAHVSAVASKALKEVSYHRDHAASWVVRLGDGTDESRRRMEAGLETVWPYASEIFERDESLDDLVASGTAADPQSLHGPWLTYVHGTLTEAGLELPRTSFEPSGGRRGLHTEAFGYLLAELQHLHRAYPGASW